MDGLEGTVSGKVLWWRERACGPWRPLGRPIRLGANVYFGMGCQVFFLTAFSSILLDTGR